MAVIATETQPVAPEPVGSRSRGGRGGLVAYAVRRIITGCGTLGFVLVFNFFLFRLLPGDPIALYTRGRNTHREQIAALRRGLHQAGGGAVLADRKKPLSPR